MKDHHDDYTQNKNINKMQYEAPCAMDGSFCGIGSLLVQDNFLLIKDGVEKSMKSDPTFHPIDGDFEELSLQQILDITDDDHFEDDSFAPTFTPSSKLAFRKSDTLALATDSPLFGNRKMTKPDPQQCVSSPQVQTTVDKDTKSSENDVCRATISMLNVDDFETGERFRPCQRGKWAEKFDELFLHRKKTGNCLVHRAYKENLALAQWVKRQRYQYKVFSEGKPSTMNLQRAEALESIGFVWDSQEESWSRRLRELREFRREFNHCNVPSNYSNKRLASWVKRQRHERNLFLEGKKANTTEERITVLESVGF